MEKGDREMRMKDIMRKSFQPEGFVKVGKMEDGEPMSELLTKLHSVISSDYATLLDNEAGVIYLKKKKKGGN